MAFIIKLIILFPLSWAMVFVAFVGTGGESGNFLPLILALGPTFLSLLVLPLSNDAGTICAMLGAACLYPAYGLLLYFVKAKILPVILCIIHLAGAVAVVLSRSVKGPLVTEPYSLILFAIIILILVSIRKERLKNKSPNPS